MIKITRLESGYYHIRGRGPCNWAQPPYWPASEEVLRTSAFPQASETFIREVIASADAKEIESEMIAHPHLTDEEFAAYQKDAEYCPVRSERGGEADSHCDCWWDGNGCCACGAPKMTDDEKRAQGMEA